MTCADLHDQLGSCLDGTADASVQAAVASHLVHCSACADLSRDLDAIRRAARDLPPVLPPARVWQSIQLRLEAGAEAGDSMPAASDGDLFVKRFVARRGWQVAAAIVAVAAAAYGTVRFDAGRRPAPDGNAVASRLVEPAVDNVNHAGHAANVDRAIANWETAIGDLERASEATRGAMDPALAGAFTTHLSAIDAAIRASRAAVTDEPDSQPARDNLIDAFQRKATVLQTAIDAGTDRNP